MVQREEPERACNGSGLGRGTPSGWSQHWACPRPSQGLRGAEGSGGAGAKSQLLEPEVLGGKTSISAPEL